MSKSYLKIFGIAVLLGTAVSSGVAVMGHDNPEAPIQKVRALCGATDGAVPCAIKTAALSPVRAGPISAVNTPERPEMTRNTALVAKQDEGDFFTLHEDGPLFDPCMLADGSAYQGPGTALDPYAKTNPCLPKATAQHASLDGVPSFPLAQVDEAILPPPAQEAGELSYYTVGDFVADVASFYTGGGGPGYLGPILTTTPSIDLTGSNDPTIPTPVPLPAPALLFLTGLAGLQQLKRKKAIA